jgi:hypothetical protein
MISVAAVYDRRSDNAALVENDCRAAIFAAAVEDAASVPREASCFPYRNLCLSVFICG